MQVLPCCQLLLKQINATRTSLCHQLLDFVISVKLLNYEWVRYIFNILVYDLQY